MRLGVSRASINGEKRIFPWRVIVIFDMPTSSRYGMEGMY